jgi:hypothetical protein
MKFRHLLFFLPLAFLFGCSNIHCRYEWGDYNEKMYAYQQEASLPNLQARIADLEDVIKMSAYGNQKIAPGIFAELAYLKKQADKSADVSAYLQKEVEFYPESAQYVEFLNRYLAGENHHE